MNNKKIAKLNLPNGKVIELPVMSGSLGPDVIDITSLYKQADMFTFDPGFTSTGSCKSDITFIDGDQGILLHRGYKIEDLAEKSSFLETSYLLMYGELPSKEKKLEFVNSITMHTMLNEQISNFYRGFKDNAHPMAILCGVVGAMAAFYHDSTDINNAEERKIASYRLIAKMPTIAAMAYKFSIGQPFVYPNNSLNYSENFLNMVFSVPAENTRCLGNMSLDRLRRGTLVRICLEVVQFLQQAHSVVPVFIEIYTSKFGPAFEVLQIQGPRDLCCDLVFGVHAFPY